MKDTPHDPEASLNLLDSRTRDRLEKEGYSCILDSPKTLLMERFSGLREAGIHSVSLDKETRVLQVVNYHSNPNLHSRTVFENYSTNFRLYNLLALVKQMRS